MSSAAELRELSVLLRAHLEWQLDCGADGLPAGEKFLPKTTGIIESVSPPEQTSAVARQEASPPRESFELPANFGEAPSKRRQIEVPSTVPAVPVTMTPLGTPGDHARLPVLAGEVANCSKCTLSQTRTKTVFSRGNPRAQICFVGEAPGQDEDEQGLPFVGRAGQLLDKMIRAMGLDPENDVYVCNIIKCRPPGNRKPTPEEMTTCSLYLREQLDIVAPKVIVAMGNTAVSALVGSNLGITKVRGQWKLYQGKTLVMPTYHPSYLLRPGPHQMAGKKQTWEDLQSVMKELGLALQTK